MEISFSNNADKFAKEYRKLMRCMPGIVRIPYDMSPERGDEPNILVCENILIRRGDKYMNIDYVDCGDLCGEESYPEVFQCCIRDPNSEILIQTNISVNGEILNLLDSVRGHTMKHKKKSYIDDFFEDILLSIEEYYEDFDEFVRQKVHITNYPDLSVKNLSYMKDAETMYMRHQSKIKNTVHLISLGRHERVGSDSPFRLIDEHVLEKISKYTISSFI